MMVELDGKIIGKVVKSTNRCWLGLDANGKAITHLESTRKEAIENLKKEYRKLQNSVICLVDEKIAKRRRETLEKAFWKCNKIGEDVIAIRIVEKYKTFEDCSDEELEAMGLYIEERMGFGKNLLTEAQWKLLIQGGFIEVV